MYGNLGIHWASTIPAFLALVCVPAPFLFYRYGEKIRAKCKYAAESDAFMKKMAAQMQQPDDEADESGSRTESDDAVDKAKEHEEEREANEQEAIDYSYGDAEDQPGFARIKTNQSRPSMTASRRKSYEGNPFALDRVNTRESFKYEGSSKKGPGLSRTSSKTSQRK